MINLFLIELKKIFHKKSLFVILLLLTCFCFLNNILYYLDYDEDGNYKYEESENLEEEELNLTEELKEYDVSKDSDVSMYLAIKTKLDIISIKKEFSKETWQYRNINDYLYDLVYQRNLYTYVSKDEGLLKEVQDELDEKLEKMNNDDWSYFVWLEKEELLSLKNEIIYELEETSDKKLKVELNEKLEDNNFALEIIDYRLSQEIKDDNSYLNTALLNYQKYSLVVKNYENMESELSYEENISYQEALAEVAINKYIIENKVNINKQNNLNYQLRTIVDDYEFFIVILILMIVSSIICEEFQSGTIKLLLIKPYSRCKILLSKYFASVLILIFSIVFLITIQLLIGSFLFGVDSLGMPVVVYQYSSESIASYSIFSYMVIRIFAKVPLLIMLLTISMFVGVVFMNAASSIAIPLLLYMFSSSLQYLSIQYNLKFMKFLITNNWEFKNYLFGKIAEFRYVNLKFSVVIWLIYFVIINVITVICFKKKNIRNI